MTGRLIVVGDLHSHGGTMEHGCAHARIDGLAIVRLGDEAACPRHGKTRVATASSGIRYYGAVAACDGDELECGAVLMARQHRVTRI